MWESIKLPGQLVLYTAHCHFTAGIPRNGADLINTHLLPEFPRA
jgi:hypothetical protein